MNMSEALAIANDIRNGCINVGEADAIITLANFVAGISERDRLIVFGCEDGTHETIVIDYGDHRSTICERCGMHWPYDQSARKRRLRWHTQRLQAQIASDIEDSQRLAKCVERVD